MNLILLAALLYGPEPTPIDQGYIPLIIYTFEHNKYTKGIKESYYNGPQTKRYWIEYYYKIKFVEKPIERPCYRIGKNGLLYYYDLKKDWVSGLYKEAMFDVFEKMKPELVKEYNPNGWYYRFPLNFEWCYEPFQQYQE